MAAGRSSDWSTSTAEFNNDNHVSVRRNARTRECDKQVNPSAVNTVTCIKLVLVTEVVVTPFSAKSMKLCFVTKYVRPFSAV